MEKEIHLLKKLNILKTFLISEEFTSEKLMEMFKEIFKDDESSVSELKLEIEKGDNVKALNFLNLRVESIRSKVFKKPCSQGWWNLIETGETDKRYCTECGKNVYKVYNIEDIKKRQNLSQCVAVNVMEFQQPSGIKRNNKSCYVEDSSELGFPILND